MLKLKLYAAILKWSKAKHKTEFVKHSCDIKCPQCNVWYSESSLTDMNNIEYAEYGYTFECGQCGHISNWNVMAFPFPALCDDKWNII